MFAITKISFFTRPLSGVESISGSSVYLSIYLFVCLSSLLILFLQTLSSRNIPQSTLITQPLPRLTSGVELCVNLTFFHTSIPRFDELFSQVLKILPSQVENVQEMFDELSAMERSRKKSVILNTGQRHQEL